MCAIAGIISKTKEAPLDGKRIEQMIASIKHRGPDQTGYYHTETAHLGMARLSIIDLTSKGLCPIVHKGASGDQVLVYNGELYNYVELRKELEDKGRTFETDCDSEVLLKSYLEGGLACLGR